MLGSRFRCSRTALPAVGRLQLGLLPEQVAEPFDVHSGRRQVPPIDGIARQIDKRLEFRPPWGVS